MATRKLNKNFYLNPNYIQYITDTAYEYCILSFLIQLSNNTDDKPSPDIPTLQMGFMARQTTVDSLDGLRVKQYISWKRRYNKSNVYTINFDKIINDIQNKFELLHNKPKKHKITVAEVKAITYKNAIKYPDVTHKAELVMGNKVINSRDEIINNVVTDFKS